MLVLLWLLSVQIGPAAAGAPNRQPQLVARGDEVAVAYGAGNAIYFAASADGAIVGGSMLSSRALRRLTLPSMLAMFAWAASAAPPAPQAPQAPQAHKTPSPPSRTPQLLVPPHRDSVSIESEPGPLIVPGRSTIPDSLVRTPQKFAREQLALGRQLERDGSLQVAMMAYANAVHADTSVVHRHSS